MTDFDQVDDLVASIYISNALALSKGVNFLKLLVFEAFSSDLKQ